MLPDFNAELHSRPSIYFSGPAYVEHMAFMLAASIDPYQGHQISAALSAEQDRVHTQVERHTEFVTVTRVTLLAEEPESWPSASLSEGEFAELAGLTSPTIICRTGILVLGVAPAELAPSLQNYGFEVTAASAIGGCEAQVCSDFRVQADGTSRIILFNGSLNDYRLGRMVRRLYEIEAYRSMALLSLPEARRLGPVLSNYDGQLVELSNRNLMTPEANHKQLLHDISRLSAHIISVTAKTRNRFGATAAYAKIVEERIAELRETHVQGFQRFGVFVARRFKPAVRTCEATALRLDQLSHATMHLLDLLQTRIQVEIEYQNALQIQAMAERTATQVKIQRTVEGFSIIAISYYLLSLIKVVYEATDKAGYHFDPVILLVSVPIVVGAVLLTVLRVKHALKEN